jgi:hypothetical protein
VWGRCGIPDVIKERTDHDKPSHVVDYIRKTSFDSSSDDSSDDADYSERHSLSYIDEEEEGAASGIVKANDDDTESESDDEDNLISQIVSQKTPTRITIKLHVTDKISSSWDSVSKLSFFCQCPHSLTFYYFFQQKMLGLGPRHQHLVRRTPEAVDSRGEQAIILVASRVC